MDGWMDGWMERQVVLFRKVEEKVDKLRYEGCFGMGSKTHYNYPLPLAFPNDKGLQQLLARHTTSFTGRQTPGFRFHP